MFELLLEARELYLQDVILNGKRYDRYVDDFINSHRYINCNSAICRNCHEMNIHIVKGLLNECAHLIQPPRVEILHIDEETADFYAEIFRALREKGKPIPTNDLWVAASTLRHGLALATLDEHFCHIDGLLLTPLS